jgi:hypothetical protein
MKQIFSFCFAIILSSGHLIAQGPTVVLSQNKCDYRELENLNQTMAEISGPILNNLVDQGKLLSWGVLQHGWGDEWNWNIYYVAKDHITFLNAWNEYITQVSEDDPRFQSNFFSRCFEHKDAIYSETVGSGSTGTGPKIKTMTMLNLPANVSMEDLQESLDAANNAIIEIGFPSNGYRLYQVDSDEIEEMRVLVEGVWTSQTVYDKIHSSEEWLKAINEHSFMWDNITTTRTYRKYYLHER